MSRKKASRKAVATRRTRRRKPSSRELGRVLGRIYVRRAYEFVEKYR